MPVSLLICDAFASIHSAAKAVGSCAVKLSFADRFQRAV